MRGLLYAALSNEEASAFFAENECPSCWICLETAGDNRPLLRDCSCRGDSAGFVHFPCLVAYAERKCHENLHNYEEFNTPWKKCPNCCQDYQNQLAIDLANECIRFVEKNYRIQKGYGRLHLEAYILKLCLLVNVNDPEPKLIIECKEIAKKCFSLIEKLKLRLGTEGSLARTSVERREGHVNGMLGRVHLKEKTKDNVKTGIEHFEKWRSISERLGHHVSVAEAELNISYAKSILQGVNNWGTVNMRRKCYQLMVDQLGENNLTTIMRGGLLAFALHDAKHCIEAERLITKLAATSRRAHGPEHGITKEVESSLAKFKPRHVVLLRSMERFLALGYEDGGDKCVIRGPIKKPRVVKEEATFAVNNNCILPVPGTPVLCHGLKSAPHLNGKIGDTRELDVNTGRVPVHFEDKRLTSELVKPCNLRILFDLPDSQC